MERLGEGCRRHPTAGCMGAFGGAKLLRFGLKSASAMGEGGAIGVLRFAEDDGKTYNGSLASLCNFANNLGQPPLNAELEPYRWAGAESVLA
jgi:hypothetical protein